MSLGLAFWILMLLWLVLYGVAWRASPQPWFQAGPNVLLFFIILILGWHVFGAPVHG